MGSKQTTLDYIIWITTLTNYFPFTFVLPPLSISGLYQVVQSLGQIFRKGKLYILYNVCPVLWILCLAKCTSYTMSSAQCSEFYVWPRMAADLENFSMSMTVKYSCVVEVDLYITFGACISISRLSYFPPGSCLVWQLCSLWSTCVFSAFWSGWRRTRGKRS